MGSGDAKVAGELQLINSDVCTMGLPEGGEELQFTCASLYLVRTRLAVLIT